jgi:hypothetical protein
MLRMIWMEMPMKKASTKMSLLPALAMVLGCTISTLLLANGGATGGGASVFSPDKGKLVIQLNGETIGSEQFELSQTGNNWLAKGTTELKVPGTTGATSVSGTLMLQPDGAPISYEWTSHADKTNGAHVVFSNGTAKITLQMQGARPFEQDLSFNVPVIAILDNNLYDQYALLAKLYDWMKRGTQTFPVLIPQDLTPGTISVEATGSQTVDGKAYEGLRVTTTDLEVLLLLDSNHRLMRLEVPSAKVSVVRQ